MLEDERHFYNSPEAQKDREFLTKYLFAFWPVALQCYEWSGRGAIKVDASPRDALTYRKNPIPPFEYASQYDIEGLGKQGFGVRWALQVIEEYNPEHEMVTVVLKPHKHRIAIPYLFRDPPAR